MSKTEINITTAKIYGLNELPYYLNEKCCWMWSLMFDERPCFSFNNLPFIYMGKQKQEAIDKYVEIAKRFKSIGIYNGDKVAIIYDSNGVIAIGKSYKDHWIDVRNNFQVKTFKTLKLNFDSLVVACV